ncbi:MAG: CHASE2 domain-containing protein [Desulfobulbaceae bacterium]|nr:CHASE2 domain-containing protein [Desulfobulbaceae bacterium]
MKRTKKNIARYGIRTFLGIILLLTADYSGLFEGINNDFYDLAFRFRGTRETSRQISIIAIDEKTLAKIGRWPIDRIYYSKLLAKLAKAQAVGFDIIFSEPSEHDAEFAVAIQQHGKVVLPVYVDSRLNLSFPVKKISSAKTGHIHLEQGIDGVTREIFHTIICKDLSLSSFAASLFNILPEKTLHHIGPENGDKENWPLNHLIQTDKMAINYYGPAGCFEQTSFVDVIAGIVPESFFNEKIVLVGITAVGIENRVLTPFMQHRNRMAGVEVHAQILNNLLNKDKIRHLGKVMEWFILFAVTILFSFLFIISRKTWTTFLWLLTVCLIPTSAFILFAYLNIWLPPANLLFAGALAFTMSYIFHLEELRDRLRQAKDDWQDSFDTIDDAITIHNSNCEIVRANRAAEKTFGPSILEMLRNRCASLCQRGKNLVQTDSAGQFKRRQTAQEEIFDQNTGKHLAIKALPRFDTDNHFAGLVHIVRDVSERKKNEKEQQNLYSQLLQAQKMEAIGTLAGGIAHDFNNILSGILGYTDLSLLRIAKGTKEHEYLREVITAVHRAKDLVAQISAFSRQHDTERIPIKINSIIKEALKLLRASLPTTIEIRQNIASETGKIFADPTQIHQVLLNLCTNASHAMAAQGGILEVTLNEVDLDSDELAELPSLNPGPHVKLRISDTGRGMEPYVLQRIFEPFFTTKEQGQGTGMGLALVHGIVMNHGGAITVRSEPDKGSTFELFFPKIASGPATREEEIVISPPGGEERILFIDDEEALVHMGKRILNYLGYDVTATTNCHEALELFRQQPHAFDLVITDQTMPHMTGIKLAEELLRLRPDIPVILCTGFSQTVSTEKIKKAGIRELALKPLTINDIAQTIRRVLGRNNGDDYSKLDFPGRHKY